MKKLSVLFLILFSSALNGAAPSAISPYYDLIVKAQKNKVRFMVSDSKNQSIELGDLVQFFFLVSGTAKNVLITGKVTQASKYPKVITFPNGTTVQIGQVNEASILFNNKSAKNKK